MTEIERPFWQQSLNLVAGTWFLVLYLMSSCTSLTPTPGPNPITPTDTPTGTAVANPSPTATATSVANLSPTPTFTVGVTPSPSAPATARRLVGYFFGSDRNNHVSDIAAGKLTAVLYAFIDITSAGECASLNAALDQSNFQQLAQLKQQNPQVKVLISVGGYSHSTYFSGAAATADTRRHFAQTCVQFMKQNGLDGIDIDWEVPVSGGKSGNEHSPEDKQNLTALLAELRSQLDGQGASDGQHYLLTIAAPAVAGEYANFELGVIPQYLDWINLETYAYYSANSPVTNLNAPLYPSSTDPSPANHKPNADAAVRAYLAAGVPAGKILLGAPLYGRGWQVQSNGGNGLYQPTTGPATDANVPKGVWNEGAILYGELEKYYLSTYQRYWQGEAKEPWLYNPSTQIMITYEDSQSLGAKADYVHANNLGGMMVWHVSADDAQHSLLNAIYSHLVNQ